MYRTTIVNRQLVFCFFYYLQKYVCMYISDIDVFIIKIFNMHVKPLCKFLCLKVEETSKTIELIAILAPPKKPA